MLKQLVQTESTADKGELAAAEILSDHFDRCAIDSTVTSWDRNRANITAQIESSRQKNALLFGCHLDVVPPGKQTWKHPPFAGLETDGKIHGRGAADMKGGIAAIVTAITEIVNSSVKLSGDMVFIAAGGEETDSCGAKRFICDQGGLLPPLAGVVIPEPTDFEVVTAHRGLLWLKVITAGRTAHGSTPQLGINAIGSMRAFLNELVNYEISCEAHELLGGCSMSVNTIEGGDAINVVPDRCTIGMDIRTLPGQIHEDIIHDLQRIFADLKRKNPEFEGEVSIVRQVDALQTDADSVFVRDFCSVVGSEQTKAVGFTTDGPYFAQLGAPVVIFGPGKSHLCHKPDECIDLTDVEKAVRHYKDIILRFLT